MQNELRALLQEAGGLILSAGEAGCAVHRKEGPANFVTDCDVAVQRLLRERLGALCPGARFIGEEADGSAGAADSGDGLRGEVLIVDPLDGTTNFIKGCGASAISVALLRDGAVETAGVFDPYRQEFFYARRGRGASCNGRPLRMGNAALKDSLVAFGTAFYAENTLSATFAAAEALLRQRAALDLRCSGSSVLDLCLVARGGAGLFFDRQLCPWDYAACSLLIEEAGGKISQLDGSPLRFDRDCSVLAGTKQARQDFFHLGLDRLALG